MTIQIGDMLVRYKADISDLTSKMHEANGVLSSSGEAVKGFGMIGDAALLGLGVAAIGAGSVAVKMAGDFQQSMTSLVTGAGESQSNLKMVSDGILAMAPQVGATTKSLAAGMYMVESAGFHGAAGLSVLRAAAEGAKVGNADLAVVTDAVTSALNSYHLSGDKAVYVTNALVATVAAGKMHMDQLAASLGSILPVAAKGGVSLNEVGAAIATMTAQGTPAAQATTYLRQMIVNLEAPGSKAVKTLKDIGLSATQVANDMRKSPDGVINTLQEISVHLSSKFPQSAAIANAEFKKMAAGTETVDQGLAHLANNTSPAYIDALKSIAGGSKNMMGMMELTGPQLTTFRQNLDNITKSEKDNKNMVAGWNLVQGDFNQQMDQGKAALETLGIKVGTILLPAVTGILQKITPLISGFSDWITKSGFLEGAVKTLSGWLGGLGDIAGKIAAPWATFWKDNGSKVTDMNTHIKDLGSAISTALGGFDTKTIGDDFGKVSKAASDVAGTISKDLGGAIYDLTPQMAGAAKNMKDDFKQMSDTLDRYFNYNKGTSKDTGKQWTDMWNFVVNSLEIDIATALYAWQLSMDLFTGVMSTALDLIKLDWGQAWQDMQTTTENIITDTYNFVVSILNTLGIKIAGFNAFEQGASGSFGGVAPGSTYSFPGHASGIRNNPVGHWAKIGEHGSETMFVPQGASIFPHGSSPAGMSSGGNGGGQGQTIILEINGVQMAQVTNVATDRLVRLKLGSAGRAA
jgi:TP901 family phage tail tape measure protein